MLDFFVEAFHSNFKESKSFASSDLTELSVSFHQKQTSSSRTNYKFVQNRTTFRAFAVSNSTLYKAGTFVDFHRFVDFLLPNLSAFS